MSKVRMLIPRFNEEDVINYTYKELTKVLARDSELHHYDYDLLFIDDGSKDRTIDIIKDYSQQDEKVKYISFSRNFGKEAAMFAGLENSQDVDAVIILDGDLQHPPELIPQMIKKYLEDGTDQVIAKRNRDGEKASRKLMTKCYYKLVNRFVDVPIEDGVGDFRLLSQRVVRSLAELDEAQRFSKGLFSWVGYPTETIEYKNQERVAGDSKWSFFKLLDYGVDGVISFNNKPLRTIMYFGMGIFGISILYLLVNFILILINGVDSPGYFTTIFAVLFLGSIQLISIGIIGEYIGRIYYEVKNRPKYLKQDTNLNDEKGRQNVASIQSTNRDYRDNHKVEPLHHAMSKPKDYVPYQANRDDREELDKEEKANQARRIKEMNL
ncbi:glycosyltransferase [Staphylococcus carnosus]|uniref:Glycosyltransferase n=1 Tax=Staphylococcus carnosus TaxID=1281 RepID=A0AAJ0NHC3_STACA|nr:glycosyltransferase [Staphylococcus carnosus]KKB25797.1 glycosyltransferase [Staphylococcus carnosus]PNZ97276.1 glycosyltransferase [Staphylococcus carnosus]QQS84323.1 glycosyltransferase [Staphylococcus carnosus]QRQ04264.1 glycosyltransferase [Staphylococcus carnosus]UTB83737.1 glycosyltransferase [Staphylococcus carnosus]